MILNPGSGAMPRSAAAGQRGGELIHGRLEGVAAEIVGDIEAARSQGRGLVYRLNKWDGCFEPREGITAMREIRRQFKGATGGASRIAKGKSIKRAG